MTKTEPLALRAAIPTTGCAIKVHADEACSAHITFDIYPEDLDQHKELFKFRGAELLLVNQEASPFTYQCREQWHHSLALERPQLLRDVNTVLE